MKISVNERRVLDAIRRHPKATRQDLVAETGLAWASVSSVVATLRERQLVHEEPSARQIKGPDPSVLSVRDDAGYFLGLFLNPEPTIALLVDFAFNREALTPTLSATGTDLKSVIRNARDFVKASLSMIPTDRLLGVGLAWPGAVDEHGQARFAPNIHYSSSAPSGQSYPISFKDILSEDQRDYLRNKVVQMEHDMPCLVRAEVELGGPEMSVRPEKNVIAVHIGRGVGAGLFINGEIVYGGSAFAGEIGHFTINPSSTLVCGCGKVGCLEQEISKQSMLRLWSRNHPGTSMNTVVDEVAKSAEDNDDEALEILDKLGERLGKALSYVVNLLNPQLIVISGEVGDRCFDLIYPSLLETIGNYSWSYSATSLRIERSTLGRQGIPLGAALGVYARLGDSKCELRTGLG